MLEFQTDWNYYVDLRQRYLALQLSFVKGRGYETYITEEIFKKTQRKSFNSGGFGEGARGSSSSRDSFQQHFPLSFFKVQVYINNQQV